MKPIEPIGLPPWQGHKWMNQSIMNKFPEIKFHDIPSRSNDYMRKMIFDKSVDVVNDGADADYEQPTPKQRILAALRDIKAGQR